MLPAAFSPNDQATTGVTAVSKPVLMGCLHASDVAQQRVGDDDDTADLSETCGVTVGVTHVSEALQSSRAARVALGHGLSMLDMCSA